MVIKLCSKNYSFKLVFTILVNSPVSTAILTTIFLGYLFSWILLKMCQFTRIAMASALRVVLGIEFLSAKTKFGFRLSKICPVATAVKYTISSAKYIYISIKIYIYIEYFIYICVSQVRFLKVKVRYSYNYVYLKYTFQKREYGTYPYAGTCYGFRRDIYMYIWSALFRSESTVLFHIYICTKCLYMYMGEWF